VNLHDVTNPADWSAEREAFEERAAIMEYDGGLARQHAEQRAEEIVEGAHHGG